MADQGDRWVIIAAVAVAIGAYSGWRSLGPSTAKPLAAGGVAAAVPAGPQLLELQGFAAPLPADSMRVPLPPSDIFAVAHDPFGASSTISVAPTPAHSAESVATDDEDGAKHEGWRVTATLLVSPRAAAVINDVLVYVGDPVPGGGKLTSVERDRVVLTDPKGGSHTVAVKEGDG